MAEEFISLAEAAALIGVSADHLRRVAGKEATLPKRRRLLKAKKIARNWVVRPSSARRWLAEADHKFAPNPEKFKQIPT